MRSQPVEIDFFEEKENDNINVFTPKTKKKLCNQLIELDKAALKNALLAAAIANLKFPDPLHAILHNFQAAYEQCKESPELALLQKAVILKLIETKCVDEFLNLLQQPFSEKQHWQTAFLQHLSVSLNLEVKPDPLVQATIQEGKIYWRIMVGPRELYNRATVKGHAFDFSTANCWLMSWKEFRTFKDAGKRTGTVSVTKARFAEEFEAKNETKANKVWNTLLKNGVLNNKFRLSKSWYAVTGINITISGLTFTHQKIADALYNITNNEDYKESIPGLTNAFIYRPARANKRWTEKNGLIQHTKGCFVQCWDVSIYHDLSTPSHQPEAHDIPIERDHVPSTSALLKKARSMMCQSTEKMAAINEEIEELQKELDEKQESVSKDKIATRSSTEIIVADECKPLEEKKALYAAEESFKKRISRESRDSFWAIAIPAILHKMSESYKEKLSEQEKQSVLSNFITHVTNIKSSDYKNDLLTLLGALRFMYRSMCKKPTSIAGYYSPIGYVPYTFFKTKDKQEIDAFFTEELQTYMLNKEGNLKK